LKRKRALARKRGKTNGAFVNTIERYSAEPDFEEED